MKKQLLALMIAVTTIILIACDTESSLTAADKSGIETTTVAATNETVNIETTMTEQTTTLEVECETIDKLVVDFMPSSNPGQLTSQIRPLKKLLKTALKNEGFDIGKIDFQVETSYEAVGQALLVGTADVGFIPGGTYVALDDQVDVILTATRTGISKDSSQAKDWNDGQPTKNINIQMPYYKSLIVAGPTPKGKVIAQKINKGETLTPKDLKDLNWGVRSSSALAGYIYPMIYLQEMYGITFNDIENVVETKSHGATMEQLALGLIDVGVIYADARSDYADKWVQEYGRENSIWEETAVVGVSPNIYNDTISVSKTSNIMTEKFKVALSNALISIAQSKEGKEVFDIYSHQGYLPASASNYDTERKAQEIISNMN